MIPSIERYPVKKEYLDLTTGHLMPMTCVELSDPGQRDANWPAMAIAGYDCGWFITVPAMGLPDIAKQMENLPGDLAACLRYAEAQGCDVIRFDADGYKASDLPLYED